MGLPMELLPWIFPWLPVLVGGVLLIPYLLGPLVLLQTFRIPHPMQIVYFEENSPSLPAEVARFLIPAREQLARLGFLPAAHFCLPSPNANVKSINVLLINASTSEGAMINCIFGYGSPQAELFKTLHVEFITRFRDGVVLQTTNSPVVGAYRQEPNDHTVQFWDTHDLATLYARHQRIADQLSAAPHCLRLKEEFRNDVERYLQQAVFQEPSDYQVAVGLMRRVPEGYRLTLRGALIFAWQELWPWKQIRKWTRRREAMRWLTLGIDRP